MLSWVGTPRPHAEREVYHFPHAEREVYRRPHAPREVYHFPHAKCEVEQFPHAEREVYGRPHAPREETLCRPSQKPTSTSVRSGSSPAYAQIIAIGLFERFKKRC